MSGRCENWKKQIAILMKDGQPMRKLNLGRKHRFLCTCKTEKQARYEKAVMESEGGNPIIIRNGVKLYEVIRK